MPHPLVLARPTDPFLLLRLDAAGVRDYRIEGDQVAVVRSGRSSDEVWLTALGDDFDVVRTMIADLLATYPDVHGLHTHADVYLKLPSEWRAADPGHWALWILADGVQPEMPTDVSPLATSDERILALLEHSPSAWLFPGDGEDVAWMGVEDGDDLVAVGAVAFSRGRAHLASVCTHPDARGRGLARRVCAGLTALARSRGVETVWLDMYADNVVAARLYASLGFTQRGRYRSGMLPRH